MWAWCTTLCCFAVLPSASSISLFMWFFFVHFGFSLKWFLLCCLSFFFPDLTKSLISQIFIFMISISTDFFYLYRILQSASFLLSFPLFLPFPRCLSFFPSLPCMTPFLFCLGSVGNSKAVSHTLGTLASLSLPSEYEWKPAVQQVYYSSFCGFHHTNYYTLMYSFSYLSVSCYYLYFTNGKLS